MGHRVGSKSVYPYSWRWLEIGDAKRRKLSAMNNISTTKGATPSEIRPNDGKPSSSLPTVEYKILARLYTYLACLSCCVCVFTGPPQPKMHRDVIKRPSAHSAAPTAAATTAGTSGATSAAREDGPAPNSNSQHPSSSSGTCTAASTVAPEADIDAELLFPAQEHAGTVASVLAGAEDSDNSDFYLTDDDTTDDEVEDTVSLLHTGTCIGRQ